MNARSSWVGLGCLLAAGCGGGAQDDAPFADGIRLKAIWQQAPDAPKQLLGWYDTALEASCQFSYPAAPYLIHGRRDEQYCIPTLTGIVVFGTNGQYADAACTQPVSYVPCQARYVIAPPSSGLDCAQLPRLFRTGAWVDQNSVFTLDAQGICSPAPPLPDAGGAYYALGDEIPLATLVHASVEIPPGAGARIRPTRLRASDGARQASKAWDVLRGESVEIPGWGVEGAPIAKWEPLDVFTNYGDGWPLFSDDTCSTWVAGGHACGDAEVHSLARYTTGASCTAIASVEHYEIGAPLDAADTFVGNFSGSCFVPYAGQVPDDGNSHIFAPGQQIEDSALADVGVVELGSARVHMQVPASPDGPVEIGTDRYFDSVLGQPCAPMTAADLSLRCLPTFGTDYPFFFADAGCTIPIALGPYRPDASCPVAAPPSAASIQISPPGSCGRPSATFRAYQVVGPHTGDVYSLSGATCLNFTEAFANDPLYDLGAEIPPDSFELITTSEHYPP
jgi:hypothetical protein